MKQILVKIGTTVDSQIGAWEYCYYCLFPDAHPTYRYTIKATSEGFTAMREMWKKAGYEVVMENDYPKH